MAYERRDPLLGCNFSVSLMDTQGDGSGVGLGTIALSSAGLGNAASFSEVSGLEMTMEVEDYAAGGLNGGVLKFPGRVKWANLTMRRGVIAKRDPMDSSDLWTWCEAYLNGVGVRKDGIIILMDQNRQPQLTWSFRRGLPLKWTGAAMNAAQSQVALESIEIAHEGLTLVRSGGVLGQAIGGVDDAIFS